MGAVHPRVLGFLGRALSLELTAVQQYMTHASLAKTWGESEAAERFRRETVEEMQHAEKVVTRMLSLGVAPAASQLRPVAHATELAGLLRLDQVLEADLIQHYGEAVRFCLLIGDGEQESFFRELWNDEQHHSDALADWYRSIAGYGQGGQERATF